ncbi:signal transduction histidine kinase [Geodermatophilus normandii]|uniref:histidine kinase n=1 Tax=Geodermatophilus normandii TaxID=1137989 RepID=A0A317QJJ8_9ACTN|nr:signal transduction histidine kinase [Geodermatophilus normandii]
MAARRRRWDRALLLVAVVYAFVVATTTSGSGEPRVSGGLFLLCAAPLLVGLVLAVRRPLDGWRLSLLGLVLTGYVLPPPPAPAPVLEGWQWLLWCPVLLAAAWASARRVSVGVAVVSLVLVTVLGATTPWPVDLRLTLPIGVVGVLASLVVGGSLGARWDARRALEAEQARTAEAQAARGALAERARIAREMHDVVAHHLSLIAVRCETAPYRLAPLDERAGAELAEVAGTARSALTELQRLLGVLRTEDQSAERAPQPGTADLGELFAGVRAAGTDLEVSVEDVDLPDTLGLTVYRIVQQAVSNAAQHAPGAPVRVTVGRADGVLRVEVVNGPGRAPGTAGAGAGLAGMRERAELHGGRLTAGPTPDAGFRVLAELPLAEVAG